MPAPLCFVLIPAGRKVDPALGAVDHDALYRDVVEPAVRAVGLDPLRADQAAVGQLERLVLCEVAVADVTLAQPRVLFELGVRQAVRPGATVVMCAGAKALDLGIDVIAYALDAEGRPTDAALLRTALEARLRAAAVPPKEDAVVALVEGIRDPAIAREKTDVFRQRVEYSRSWKAKLAEARSEGTPAIERIEASLGPLGAVESGVLVDLLLSYRAVSAHAAMVELAKRMPAELAATTMVREQRAFALNRLGRGDEAEAELVDLLATRGPSSETYALLGRVYKDRWAKAVEDGHATLAERHLQQAVATYLAGFEADSRDAFPGINALTMMELSTPPDPRRVDLAPVVRYTVERRMAGGRPDYWDHATLVELAVLARDEARGAAALGRALGCVRERWEPESTARNLALIRQARERRGDDVPAWTRAAEDALASALPVRLPAVP